RIPARLMLAPPPSPALLLRIEHDVARALVDDAPLERVLQAIGEPLAWGYGGGRAPPAGAGRGGAAGGSAPAPGGRARPSGEGPPGRVEQTGEPTWVGELDVDDNFPRRQLAA